MIASRGSRLRSPASASPTSAALASGSDPDVAAGRYLSTGDATGVGPRPSLRPLIAAETNTNIINNTVDPASSEKTLDDGSASSGRSAGGRGVPDGGVLGSGVGESTPNCALIRDSSATSSSQPSTTATAIRTIRHV